MTENSSAVFTVSDISLLSADVHLGSEEAHPIMWEVSYGEREASGFYFASGWLHAAGDGIQVSVSVGSVLTETGTEYDHDDPREAIRHEDEMLDELYQRARSAARVLVALTDFDLDLPMSMPEPLVGPFEAEISEEAEPVFPDDQDQ